jgi:hypothetical protein
LQTTEQKEIALRLSYEIIRSNGVNVMEAMVYQHLLDLLALPQATVQAIEAEINEMYAN